jgi:hypothetical protein
VTHNLNRIGLCDCASCAAQPPAFCNKAPERPIGGGRVDARWAVIEIDEPRGTLTPCRAEVFTVDELLEAEREQRARRGPLLAGLEEFGRSVKWLREFLAGVREQYRRSACDPSKGIRRPALRVEIDDGVYVDWESSWCFEDTAKHLNGHDFHGVAGPRWRRLPLEGCGDDEPDYVDELRLVPEVAALQIIVLPDIQNQELDADTHEVLQ